MSRNLYLGRDAESNKRLEIDPDVFTTHGVILGMTGSGKTGLALGMLEEMVEAGIPVIAVDPKGDLPNLGLLFPGFESSRFEAWTDPAEAQREGLSPAQLAEKEAAGWKKGLAAWELDGSDIERVKSKMNLRIFTPGSGAVNPVNLLASFRPPAGDLPEEETGVLSSGAISGLLSLILDNIDALRDPRHVLLVQILTTAWRAGQSLTLEDLIGQLVDPPFAKVGVFPVDRFLPPDDRMKLALQLNTLVASPTFAAWKEGEPLDVARFMESGDGRVPVNIFSIAHLSEKERQFFVTRLMNEVLSWSRGLSGSSSLRAFVYFDEVSGYLPPHPYNPPSKAPILTLLKQSRAVGVGLCLATQNPVDLDYKALSNIGTWMIGRLQTEQDRNRVRDGLMSATGGLTASELEAEFSKIQPRTFLLKMPRENKPHLLQTRWAMSYLRGPVTLSELPGLVTPSTPTEKAAPAPAPAAQESGKGTPPPVPTGFGQSFLDPRFAFHNQYDGFFEQHSEAARSDGKVLNRPALRAVLRLQFDESKDNFVLHLRHHFVAFPLNQGGSIAPRFRPLDLNEDHLLKSASDDSVFVELPEHLDQTEELEQAQKELVEHLYRTLTSTRFVNDSVKLYSRPNESREDFQKRCAEEADKMADEAAVKLRQKLESKIESVGKKIDRTKDKVERLAQSEQGKKLEGLWRAGEAILGLFTKKRRSFGTVLGSSRRALEAGTRTKQAEGELEQLQEELLELQQELEEQLAELEAGHKELAGEVEERELRLDKSDIQVERFEILWVPVSKRI